MSFSIWYCIHISSVSLHWARRLEKFKRRPWVSPLRLSSLMGFLWLYVKPLASCRRLSRRGTGRGRQQDLYDCFRWGKTTTEDVPSLMQIRHPVWINRCLPSPAQDFQRYDIWTMEGSGQDIRLINGIDRVSTLCIPLHWGAEWWK